MKSFEILAPVGAKEQLYAAVRCGANAVYLGAGNFNARRNAENFTDNDLKDAIKYCHLRNVKVYVTLNTLVFDKEMNALYDCIKNIAKCGADAVIIQDFAVFDAVKAICPDMPVHASTQMAVHNISGAKFLEKLGFSRVVLARELTLNEIKLIRENTTVELEVFVHGAHCMSTSGNCYLSAMLGERSGNRGLCAQGCRLNWQNRHGREYALSLKDMSYLDSINELQKIGVESFKIEGRMKRPEYVAAAVSSLKKAMNNEFYDRTILRSVFSRNGFTDGYLKGERNVSMFGFRNKEDVTSAQPILKELEQLYKDDIRPNKTVAKLILKKDEPTELTFTCNNETVTVTGEIPQEPRTSPLSYEIALRNLSKLGDTSLYLDSLTFENEDSLTLPASAINALRRNGAELLEKELCKVNYNINDAIPQTKAETVIQPKRETRIRLESFSQYSEIFNKVDMLILKIDDIIKYKDEIELLPVKICAELPALIYPENEDKVLSQLKEIKKIGIVRGSTGNISGIALLKKAGFHICGNHGLNITNSVSLKKYKDLGLDDITFSFELTEKAIKNMTGTIKSGAYVYGHLPLMLLRACPQKGENGCEKCNGVSELTDRKGITFPLICHNKVYSVLYNSVPLYIGDKNLPDLSFATLYFTKETKTACENIFKAYLQNKNIEGKKTNGLFYRELI